MRIIPLLRRNNLASRSSYLLLGDWNRLEDVNTLIDPGDDGFVLNEIERLSAGFGTLPVAQIILTHNNFNHDGALKAFKNHFNARVFAFHAGPDVDEQLCDGQFLKAGDDILEVLHTPGNSSDAICLYAPSEKTLFAGDTRLRARWPGDVCSADYVEGLLKIACRDIQKMYFGYDSPILSDCQEIIQNMLRNIHDQEVFGPCTRRLKEKGSAGKL